PLCASRPQAGTPRCSSGKCTACPSTRARPHVRATRDKHGDRTLLDHSGAACDLVVSGLETLALATFWLVLLPTARLAPLLVLFLLIVVEVVELIVFVDEFGRPG